MVPGSSALSAESGGYRDRQRYRLKIEGAEIVSYRLQVEDKAT